jgi:DNA-binding MarR family transcriptional regulator
MEAAGLLRRTRNPENERQVIIALTPEGDALRFRAGCLNANLLEASGQTVGELGKLNQLIRQLRDAIYAHTGALGVGKPRSTS